LIQKEHGPHPLARTDASSSGWRPLEGRRIKSSTYPHHRLVRPMVLVWLVYLTWNNIVLCPNPRRKHEQPIHTRISQTILMFLSLNDVKSAAPKGAVCLIGSDDQRHLQMPLMV
jgi:hypothetical protein